MTEKTKPTNKLKEAYENLPKKEADRFRKKIMDTCCISYTVFFNWINGITPVPKLSRILISTELGISEYTLFMENGKPLFMESTN